MPGSCGIMSLPSVAAAPWSRRYIIREVSHLGLVVAVATAKRCRRTLNSESLPVKLEVLTGCIPTVARTAESVFLARRAR